MKPWWLVALVGSRIAAAEPATPAAGGPVNLLTAVPTTVAVSSTVDNRAILPQHLVDGDLATAWNSRTDELVGAWIAVRVPDGARVTGVRLTVGFTKRDRQRGDLFTANPRIKRVRVSHGETSVERALDVDNRGLQEIAIAGGGGDYRIEVLEVVPGSRRDWREVCVSELELWGVPPVHPSGRARPTVRVGSLDPPPPPPRLSEADCRAIAEEPRAVSADLVLRGDALSVCDVVTSTNPNDPWDVQRHDLFVVARQGKHATAIGDHASAESQRMGDGAGPSGPDHEVSFTEVPLTLDESALLVEETAGNQGSATLYRVSGKAGLAAVLTLDTHGRRCTASSEAHEGAARALPDLTVDCGRGAQRYRYAAGTYARR